MTMISYPSTCMVVGPVGVTVGADITIVRAVDVAARDVVLRMAAAVGKHALARKSPFGDEERLGRIGRVNSP